MKITRNLGSIVVSAAVTTLLAACSANPVDDNNKKPTVVANKVVAKASVKNNKPKTELLAEKKITAALANANKNKQLSAKKVQSIKPSSIVVAKKPIKRVVTYKKPVTRTKQIAKAKPALARKIVKPSIHLASRPIQVKSRASYRQPVQANYRKAVYRKPVQHVQQKRKFIPRINPNNSFGYALSNAAVERTKHRVRYDGRYLKIGYPWGDVPKSIGVCTDVVIRAYRRLGIDLQQEVHKDISKDFYAYPNLTKWGLEKPDPNIDHRRVYNLQAFFKRHKAELPRSRNPRDYKPGDLVTWMVGPTFPHIGVVVNQPSPADPNRLMIAHNVGAGPVIEDILFRYPMTGHYRYTPEHRKVNPALHFAKTPTPASVLRKKQRNQLSYAQLLQASRYLESSKPVVEKQVKSTTKLPARMYLAQLDSVLNPARSDLNSAAVQALLKK